jgi:hypothetical protein
MMANQYSLICITIFTLLIGQSSSLANEQLSKVIKSKGKAFLDNSRDIDQKPIKVGSQLIVKDARSFIDANYKNMYFRLSDGEITLEEANFEKGKRDIFRQNKGRGHFFLDKNFGNNFFQVTTPHLIVSITGNRLHKATKVLIEVTNEKTTVYVHKGMIEITLPKIKKRGFDLLEGNSFSYAGSGKAEEQAPPQLQTYGERVAAIFEQFTPAHDENELYIHPSKKALFEKQPNGAIPIKK